MSKKHIDKLEDLVYIKRSKLAERLVYAASAFAQQELDADVLTYYNNIRNSIQDTLDDIETGLMLWRTNHLDIELNTNITEQKEYIEVLNSMSNDKSPNKDEVAASLANGVSNCQLVINKLLVFKNLGDLPNSEKNIKKLNNKLKFNIVDMLMNKFISLLDMNLEQLNKFIKEEID